VAVMNSAGPPPRRYGSFEVDSVLGAGGMGVVYKAHDVGDKSTVALKTLSSVDPGLLQALRREIHALKGIHHEGIVKVIDDGVQDGIPWYAMELIDGPNLADFIKELWGGKGSSEVTVPTPTTIDPKNLRATPKNAPIQRPLPPIAAGRLEETLERFIALCEPLAALHGNGLVHRDLKPANVLYRADGSPVLADFGLATIFSRNDGRESLDAEANIAGTMVYAAPEQLQGEYVDARADLYSLGCILYRALTGEPPFKGSIAQMVRKMSVDPPPVSARVSGTPSQLDLLVMRMLARQPVDRVGFADHLGMLLAELAGQVAPRSHGRPVSYLYRPGLVGRESLVTELEQAVNQCHDGQGSCRVLTGESGIGKTRMLMAANALAERNQLKVFRGNCSQPGQGRVSPMRPFRHLIEGIVDHCRTAEPEVVARIVGARAKVLSMYEPLFGEVPGHDDQPEAPPLPPEAAEDRLVSLFTETVVRFVDEAPTTLLLDDLQWADRLTLAVVRSLAMAATSAAPLMIVGTSRTENLTPEVLRLLEHDRVKRIEVSRLGSEDVGAIVKGMLAWETAPTGLTEFLAEQSEGNPFFVVEYLRAAVGEGILFRDKNAHWRVDTEQDTNEAEAFRALGLPTSLRELLERRLVGLSEEALQLVELASVKSGDISDAVLQQAFDVAEDIYMVVVAELTKRQILETTPDGRLRFTHSQLRDAARERVPAEQRKDLHKRMALAMEAKAPDEVGRLAHHFAQAGMVNKAIKYGEKAGDRALIQGANQVAAGHYTQLLELEGSDTDKVQRAEWRRRLGEASFGLGNMDEAKEHLETVFDDLGMKLPASPGGWKRRMAGQSFTQIRRVMVPLRLPVSPAKRRELLVAAKAGQRLSHVYYYSAETLKQLAITFLAVNLGERASQPEAVAQAYASLGYLASVFGMSRLSQGYFTKGRDGARAMNDGTALTMLDLAEANMSIGQGKYEHALTVLEHAVERSEEISNFQTLEQALMLGAAAEYYLGRYDSSVAKEERVRSIAEPRNSEQNLVWGILGDARCKVRQQALGQTRSLLAKAAEREMDEQALLVHGGLEAIMHLREGHKDEALEAAKRLRERMGDGPPKSRHAVDALWSLGEVYLAQDEPDIEGLTYVTAAMGKLGRLFGVANLKSGVFAGYLAMAAGKSGKALKTWRHAIAQTSEATMPFHEAMTRYMLGSSDLLEDDAERREHLTKALELFEGLGCRYDASRVKEALSALGSGFSRPSAD